MQFIEFLYINIKISVTYFMSGREELACTKKSIEGAFFRLDLVNQLVKLLVFAIYIADNNAIMEFIEIEFTFSFSYGLLPFLIYKFI